VNIGPGLIYRILRYIYIYGTYHALMALLYSYLAYIGM
jgi:hypothetical protein